MGCNCCKATATVTPQAIKIEEIDLNVEERDLNDKFHKDGELDSSKPKRPILESEAVFKPVDIFDVLNGDVAAPDQPPPPNISPAEYKNTDKPAGKVMYVPEEPGEALLKIEDTFWEEKRIVLPDLNAMKAIEDHAVKVFSPILIHKKYNPVQFSLNNKSLIYTHRHQIQSKHHQKP